MKLNLQPEKVAGALKERRAQVEKKGRVLIVDDEVANLEALRQLLSRSYDVVATADPAVALENAVSSSFDLIITDQRMPGRLGTDLLKEIKARNDDNVRMILTGYTDVGDLITCINAGLIYRYLVKPWNPEEILSVANEAMAKIQTERTVKRLVPQQIVERLYGGSLKEARPGHGKEVECAVAFLDIREFTSLAGEMTPPQAFGFLTSYMSCVGPVIEAHHGFIDKYLGDGLLAVFDRSDEFAVDAVRCAIAIVNATREYNLAHRSGPVPEFRTGGGPRRHVLVGLGINTGHVMLGAVGFSRRLEFTVLGDCVNAASRIESLTKHFGVQVLVHGDIASKLPPDVAARSIGDIRVRGKSAPVALWEVFEGDEPALRAKKLETKTTFAEAVSLAQSAQDDQAKVLFERVLAQNPDDNVSRYYLESIGRRPPHLYARAGDVLRDG